MPGRSRRPAARVLLSAAVVVVVTGLGALGWVVAHHPAKPSTSAASVLPPHQAHHAPAPPKTLKPVSAKPFDPYGDTQGGDNGDLAPLAIDTSAATAWHTDWYTTARFGNLKPGTGLLLDMGRTVTLTAAKIVLGSTPGASFQVRAGASAGSLKDLAVVARAHDAGGRVGLRLAHPVRGRYVLIWFTKLPPDPAGTFQASVYRIGLKGRA